MNTCNVYEKTLWTLDVNLQFVVFNHLQPKTMNELKKKRLSGIISKTPKKNLNKFTVQNMKQVR